MENSNRIEKLTGLNVIICIHLIAMVYGLYNEIAHPLEKGNAPLLYTLYFGYSMLIFGLYRRSKIARIIMLIILWIFLVFLCAGMFLIVFTDQAGEYHWGGYLVGILGLVWEVWQISYFNNQRTMRAFGLKVIEKGYSGDKACPYCNGRLRSPRARQCPHCLMSWHDSDSPRKLHA